MIRLASRSARDRRAAAPPRRVPGSICATISVLGLAFVAGCSSPGAPEAKTPAEGRVAELEREKTQLNERIARLQRERDEAVAAARRANTPPETGDEAGGDPSAAPAPTTEARSVEERPANSGRPELTIEKLGPDGAESVVKRAVSEAELDEEEPEPRLRPVLRVYGSEEGDVAQVVTSDSEPPEKTPVVALDGEGAPDKGRTPPSPAEKKKQQAIAAAASEYETAMSAVREKDCAKAEPGLRRFLTRHPDHPYSDNALYWLGDCQFQRGDYGSARDSFASVEARYPGENKVPDALLKLALSYEHLGQTDEAKKTVGRLRAAHPATAAARRIPETYSSK